ncbi:MAG: sigma-54 dependent transcriptional regulator, partial [Halofilum sp. (in: g-proteobacteria)]
MTEASALVVDDEADIRELVEITLGRMGIDTTAVGDVAAARAALSSQHFDLCVTDMRLPDGDGLELVRLVADSYPAIPIAVITAHGSMDAAVTALKAGAFDFVSKPVDLEDLRRLAGQALRLGEEPAERARDKLIGGSPAIEAVRTRVARVARSQAPVVVTGESGVGKELVARMIHRQGPRADAPFVPVNCGAIPRELMESEFFGHARGSFTGATSEKEGLFAAAAGGTLFLDEVVELPLDMQVKLLRAIQEKQIRPVGKTRETPVDVRIVSATHGDLGAAVTERRFREDLYYRINVIALHVPPLRERRDDIEPLANAILERSAQGRRARLTPDALAALHEYPFPGNVRELENILEGAMALA